MVSLALWTDSDLKFQIIEYFSADKKGCAKSFQLCPTLSDPIDCGPWDPPGKNTGVDCHALLQGVFLT